MKTSKKLLPLIAGLSTLRYANDCHSSLFGSNFSEQLQGQVLKDVKEVRSIRHYRKNSKDENKEYDENVGKTVSCFSGSHEPSSEWNEMSIIVELNKCAVENNYPNIQALDDKWENKVQNQQMQGIRIMDATLMNGNFLQYIMSQPNFFTSSQLKESNAIVQHKLENAIIKTTIDNFPIIFVYFDYNYDLKHQNMHYEINIIRTPFAQTDYSKNNLDKLHSNLKENKELYPSFIVIEKHLNNLANQLLDGDFKNQEHAIDLLLEYKMITSMPFSIEASLGTQFTNILKMNYLMEAIKEKYPSKINKNLRIPHIFDFKKFADYGFFQCPEIAVTFVNPEEFIETQKKQIENREPA